MLNLRMVPSMALRRSNGAAAVGIGMIGVCGPITETIRTREGRMVRYTLPFTEAGENQYPTNQVNSEDSVRDAAAGARQSAIEQLTGGGFEV